LPAARRRERPRDSRAAQTADEISTSEWTAQHVFSTLPVGIIITVSPRPVSVLGEILKCSESLKAQKR
jgi:hypothetical protein